MKKKHLGKYVLAIIVVLLSFAFMAGCSKTNDTPKPPDNDDDRYLKMSKGSITLIVGREIKYFNKKMIPTATGKQAASILVKISNQAIDPVHIAPGYTTIKTDNGKSYKHKPELGTPVQAGKGYFRELDIAHDEQGGGLLLFEIGDKEQIKEVNYKDKSGHDITITFPDEDTQI